MLSDKSSNVYIVKLLTILIGIAVVWTSISLYFYYTGPQFTIDTYMTYVARQDYEKVYELLDIEQLNNLYGKEEIIAYYKRIYEVQNHLLKLVRNSKPIIKKPGSPDTSITAFSNIKYVFSDNEHTAPLYLVKRADKWMIRFPFELSAVKIYAPIGSTVYLDGNPISIYNQEAYTAENVLPGQYLVQIEFPGHMYNTYRKTIVVPEEKEVLVPYNTLNVEIATIRNMIIELEGVKKKSDGGIAIFNNVLEGNYHLRIYSPNNDIEPIEMPVHIHKDKRLFSCFDVTLSETGKNKLSSFTNDFYKSYIKDIKNRQCLDLLNHLNKETNNDFIKNFKDWFIENKTIQDAKMSVQQSNTSIDQLGFIHTDLLETIELTNREFDEYENREINKQYRLILEWETIIDMSEGDWKIIDRKIKQSLVSYKDFDGKWVQY